MILGGMIMGRRTGKAMLSTHTTTHTVAVKILGESVEVKSPRSGVNVDPAGRVRVKAVKSG